MPRPRAALRPTPTDSSCRRTDGDGDVRWIAPETERDRIRLAAWCSAVGPVIISNAQPSDARADRLVIATWNTHVGGGDLDAFIARLRRGDFISGAPVPHFVLLLQEVFRRGPDVPVSLPPDARVPRRIAERPPSGVRRDIRQVASEQRLDYVYAPAMRNGEASTNREAEDRGNAIVSTERLREATIIELPMEHQRRIAVAVVVEGTTTTGERWRVRLIDAHLDTAVALGHGGPLTVRRRQAEAITDAVRAMPSATAVVVGGDFNTWLGDREPAVKTLRRAFGELTERETTTWRGPLGVHATLDHLFVRLTRGDFVARRVPERLGSDHYPVIATLTF